MTSLPLLDARTVRAVPISEAVDALVTELESGPDPASDPPRVAIGVPAGQLLLVPSAGHAFVGVKVAVVAPGNPAAGLPRVQGVYILLDAATLRPLAVFDGVALTTLRTAALSAVAGRLLARPDARRLVVFGSGPQAESHIGALTAMLAIDEIIVVGHTPGRAEDLADRWSGRLVSARVGSAADVAGVDIVVCATTSRRPLFDGATVGPDTLVIAVGSHEPEVVELDTTLMGRAQVVVEDPATALREAGEVVTAVRAGVLAAESLTGIADLVCGRAAVDRSRPRVFKSVGMAWEDRAVAAASSSAAGTRRPGNERSSNDGRTPHSATPGNRCSCQTSDPGPACVSK